jgi:kumamolisin
VSSSPTDPEQRIELSLLIRPRASLDELEARLNSRSVSSVAGDEPLSREEFAASYGADPADVANVEAFARQHSLQVIESSPARRTIRLAGRAADIATAFGVSLHDERANDGTTFRVPDSPGEVPADLQGVVVGIFGLDTRPIARPAQT